MRWWSLAASPAAAAGILGLAVARAGVPAPAPAAPTEIVVYAASSLRDVLQRLAPACEKAIEARLVFNFGASNDLARQIEAANKADAFLSADEAWMDHVARVGLVDPGSRRSLLSNRLVVVGASDSALRIGSASDLGSPAIRRIALGNPEAVPAGKYARAWLEKAGVWESVADRVTPALDVRAALAAVESGAAGVGIVYRTDAAISSKVRVLYEVPAAEEPRISYAVAALGKRPNVEAARRFVAWLAGPAALAAFERSGFIVQAGTP
ncbi:MAG TPA: molybdate ABC transporter substrate-binding protein [Candidatus Polarisedimenticolia bacterium]|jgi:molybdate transport system substrate-binding protein|nr:molybdate ABC transporter substrate-binding protein [Candidatus Polarisedimenticolia bacterium]